MSDASSERRLLDAAVGGDSTAMEQLLMRHFMALEQHVEPRIPAEARRHLGVEDILQEVLRRLSAISNGFSTAMMPLSLRG